MRTLIQHLRWADYVLLTNASTYVNIPLLDAFVQSLDDNDMRIYCGRVISAQYMSGPYAWCFYGEGSAILLRRPYINYVMDNNKWRKHVMANDHVTPTDPWLFYKRNITDTAIGTIVNDLLLSNDTATCLQLLEVDDSAVRTERLDHTLYWQDWGQDTLKNVTDDALPFMATVDCRGTSDEETIKNLWHVHEVTTKYYKENYYRPDMRYIEAYVDNPQTPVVTKSLDKPDCCIDDYEKVPFDDYHKWLEENSDIPNLEVDENGHLVEHHETPKKRQTRYDQWGEVIPEGMTYAEYFNIPFWDHRCWYKHPWAGDNFCGCCQREQLVYPQGSPTHQHDGTEDCGCGQSGSGSSGSGGSSGGSSVKPDPSCGCFDWDVI